MNLRDKIRYQHQKEIERLIDQALNGLNYCLFTLGKEEQHFECSGRLSVVYHHDDLEKIILSYSVTPSLAIILNRIELPEELQGHGLGLKIINVLWVVALIWAPDARLSVKYPDNKNFWSHYKHKYNQDVNFIEEK